MGHGFHGYVSHNQMIDVTRVTGPSIFTTLGIIALATSSGPGREALGQTLIPFRFPMESRLEPLRLSQPSNNSQISDI